MPKLERILSFLRLLAQIELVAFRLKRNAAATLSSLPTKKIRTKSYVQVLYSWSLFLYSYSQLYQIQITFVKMRAFASKFCQDLCIFHFVNNLWFQYTSRAYQMNCVKSLALWKRARNKAMLTRAASFYQTKQKRKKWSYYVYILNAGLRHAITEIVSSSKHVYKEHFSLKQVCKYTVYISFCL